MDSTIDARMATANGDDPNGTGRKLLQSTLKAAAFGEIMSVMLQSPRHGKVTLETIARQLVPAYLTEQYVLARAKPDDAGVAAPVGVAFWASVSEAIDHRIEANPDQPIELGPEEWESGKIVWILDIVAAPQISNALVKSIRERIGPDRLIKIRTIDDAQNRIVRVIE